jgi:hypothetical protein
MKIELHQNFTGNSVCSVGIKLLIRSSTLEAISYTLGDDIMAWASNVTAACRMTSLSSDAETEHWSPRGPINRKGRPYCTVLHWFLAPFFAGRCTVSKLGWNRSRAQLTLGAYSRGPGIKGAPELHSGDRGGHCGSPTKGWPRYTETVPGHTLCTQSSYYLHSYVWAIT